VEKRKSALTEAMSVLLVEQRSIRSPFGG